MLRHQIVTWGGFEKPAVYGILRHQKGMKTGAQLELELKNQTACRSMRRRKKARPAQLWFEKMRQVVDAAADAPVRQEVETRDLASR